MNIIKYFIDNTGKIESTLNTSVAQNSYSNVINLYIDNPSVISVDITMRQPDGKLLPKLHMAVDKDEAGNKI